MSVQVDVQRSGLARPAEGRSCHRVKAQGHSGPNYRRQSHLRSLRGMCTLSTTHSYGGLC
jgi:hypothetical protein